MKKKENEWSIVTGVTITILKFIKNDTQAYLKRLLKHLRRVHITCTGLAGIKEARGSETESMKERAAELRERERRTRRG